MDAIYILSPQPHIVDCLCSDFQFRRYRRAYIIWTGPLPDPLQRRLDPFRAQMAGPPDLLLVDFFPHESHLVTFRDPHSFLVLYNPACNDLVARHLRTLASKVCFPQSVLCHKVPLVLTGGRQIVSVCVTLQEMPKIRYYRPPDHIKHEASVLCMHLARFVQQELDGYQQWNRNFPPPSSRPPSVLLITDRSMDLMAPFLHEFTYQAMVHDLLPIKEHPDGKVTFHLTVGEGTPDAEEKDAELAEKDPVWVSNRHRHMKDTIDKLMSDFQNFLKENPNFAGKDPDSATLNDIKGMLARLPQFQEMKQAYSLHLTMAQEAMNIFQKYKLADLASAEQTLATGLDEEYKKPKNTNILDQVVRLLDDPDVAPADRLRLIAIYVLFRDGIIPQDLSRLLWHAGLQRTPESLDQKTIENLELLGARPLKQLKESRTPPPPLFDRSKDKHVNIEEEYILSRYEPAVKTMLERLVAGTLDPNLFPYTKPPQNPSEESFHTHGSLRSAAPRWASANRRQVENRQRIIVFVAGGATYSEARACYEVSEKHNRDVFLVTSHMVSPAKFLSDLRLLTADRPRLDLPLDRPPPKAPAYLFERPAPPKPVAPPPGQAATPGGARQMGMTSQHQPAPQQQHVQPPTKAMGNLSISGGGGNGGSGSEWPSVEQRPGTSGSDKAKKEKKKRHLFGLKKS